MIPYLNLKMEPATTKDVNDRYLQGTSNSMVTHPQNTNSTGIMTLFSIYFLYLMGLSWVRIAIFGID